MGCYCSATSMPPCSWCENSGNRCDNCGDDIHDHCEVVGCTICSDDSPICADCHEEQTEDIFDEDETNANEGEEAQRQESIKDLRKSLRDILRR